MDTVELSKSTELSEKQYIMCIVKDMIDHEKHHYQNGYMYRNKYVKISVDFVEMEEDLVK